MQNWLNLLNLDRADLKTEWKPQAFITNPLQTDPRANRLHISDFSLLPKIFLTHCKCGVQLRPVY